MNSRQLKQISELYTHLTEINKQLRALDVFAAKTFEQEKPIHINLFAEFEKEMVENNIEDEKYNLMFDMPYFKKLAKGDVKDGSQLEVVLSNEGAMRIFDAIVGEYKKERISVILQLKQLK